MILALSTLCLSLAMSEMPEWSTPLPNLSGPALRQDSVHFSASLSTHRMVVGETVTLELSLETKGGHGSHITTPRIPEGLEVISTSDFNQANFSLPGGRSRTLRREIVIYATRSGTFQIPAATARVRRGKSYRTSPLTLTVVDTTGSDSPRSLPRTTPSTPSAPVPAARGPGDEVLLSVQITPETAYVHQQVTLTARAWIAEEIRLWVRRAPEYQAPNVPGLWTDDLQSATRSTREWIEDRAYRVQEFERAYFALSPGRYVIPPARLDYQIRRSFSLDYEDQSLSTDSITLTVLPLPDEGRPTSFTGAVGNFSLVARIEPAVVPTGEAASLVVELEGSGNLKSVPAPVIPKLDGIDLYPPTEESTIYTRGGVIGGSKRFTWILIPRATGKIEVPPVEYGFFDPGIRQYRTVRSSPLTISALGPAGPGPESGYAPPDIGLEWRGRDRHSWLRSPLVGTALIVLLGLLVLSLRRATPMEETQTRHSPHLDPGPTLDRLRRDLTQPRNDDGLRELALLIREILARNSSAEPSARLPHPPNTRPDPRTSNSGALLEIIERIDALRYRPTPSTPREQLELLNEVERLLYPPGEGDA